MTKTEVDWKGYISSGGVAKEEIERDLIKQKVLSPLEVCNWSIFVRKDNMLLNPAMKDVVGLFFTREEYALGYVKEKYETSHREPKVYRFCNSKISCKCCYCHLKQAVKIIMRFLVKR